MKYSHNGGLVKVLTCGSICWCHRHTRSHQFGISSEADFQMSEGSEKKHVTVARSTDSHPKDGESASTKSTLVVQHRNLSRPSAHFPLYLLHPKSSPFLWHATPSPISNPASNLWSNPLLLNASTNTSPFHPLFNLHSSLWHNCQCLCSFSFNRPSPHFSTPHDSRGPCSFIKHLQ